MYCPYLSCGYRNVQCPYAYNPLPAVRYGYYREAVWVAVRAVRKLIGALRSSGTVFGTRVATFLEKEVLGRTPLGEFLLKADLENKLAKYIATILPGRSPEHIELVVEGLLTFLMFVIL